MSLVNLKTYSRVGLASTTVASGVQLISTQSVLAHAEHNMAEPSESLEQTAAPGEQKTAQPESTATEADAQEASPGQAHSDMEEAMPSMDAHHGNENAVLEVPATQGTASVIEAGVSNNGFSVGLGESLLGLIIVGPVVFIALKKRF